MPSKPRGTLSRRTVMSGAAAGAGALLLNGCLPEDVAPFFDAGVPDAGLPDAREPDAGMPDAGVTDAGVTPQCAETEDNLEGPYYRAHAPFRSVLANPADGEWLVISGIAAGMGSPNGGQCIPLTGMLLDVWAADAGADYHMASSEFLFRGRFYPGKDGRFTFETVLPGRYLNGNAYRPRHIHLKASHPGYVPLTTQIYFEGDPYIAIDPFVHPSLVIPLHQTATGAWHGAFPVVLAKV